MLLGMEFLFILFIQAHHFCTTFDTPFFSYLMSQTPSLWFFSLHCPLNCPLFSIPVATATHSVVVTPPLNNRSILVMGQNPKVIW